MNRVQQELAPWVNEAGDEDSPVSLAVCRPLADGHDSALFVPLHYEPNYAYPLLVWLHGPRDSQQQLMRIMPLVSMRNFVGVAPRGPLEHRATSALATTWSWSDDEASLSTAEQRVTGAIELTRRRLNIAPRRVFLAGYSTGGTLALRLAMAHPQRFAGVISLGGRFPTGGSPLRRLGEARGVPILLACGQTSREYPQADVCSDLRLLHSGGMNVALRIYPCGDEISPLMLPDMNRWIMDLVIGCPQAVQA
ncbi:MAG: alpha/beta hydrolase [Pirellulales bacterium]